MVPVEDYNGCLLRFYSVVCMVRYTDGRLWAISAPMLRLKLGFGKGMRISDKDGSMIQLSVAVHRAGAALICEDSCVPPLSKKECLANCVRLRGWEVITVD